MVQNQFLEILILLLAPAEKRVPHFLVLEAQEGLLHRGVYPLQVLVLEVEEKEAHPLH